MIEEYEMEQKEKRKGASISIFSGQPGLFALCSVKVKHPGASYVIEKGSSCKDFMKPYWN